MSARLRRPKPIVAQSKVASGNGKGEDVALHALDALREAPSRQVRPAADQHGRGEVERGDVRRPRREDRRELACARRRVQPALHRLGRSDARRQPPPRLVAA